MTWIVRSAPIVTWHFKGWWLDNSWQMALDTFFRHFAKLREVLRNLRIYCMYCTSTLGKLCGQDCFILDFGLSRGRRIDVIWQAWHGLFDIHNLQAQHAEYRGLDEKRPYIYYSMHCVEEKDHCRRSIFKVVGDRMLMEVHPTRKL